MPETGKPADAALFCLIIRPIGRLTGQFHKRFAPMRLSRRSEVDPFIVMDVMEAASKAEAEGRHIIHMEVGQPGTPAPAAARQKVAKAMESGSLGYTVALGLPALRERIGG